MGASKVSDGDFVVCWATARSIDDVVAGTGLGKDGVKYRAKALRERGVQLHKLPLHFKDDEVDELNKLFIKHYNLNKGLK